MLKKIILTSTALLFGFSTLTHADDLNLNLKSNPNILSAIQIAEGDSLYRVIDVEFEPVYGPHIYKTELTGPTGEITVAYVDVEQKTVLSSQPQFTTPTAAQSNAQWYNAAIMHWISSLNQSIIKAEKLTQCDAIRADYDGLGFYEIDLNCHGQETEIYLPVSFDGSFQPMHENS